MPSLCLKSLTLTWMWTYHTLITFIYWPGSLLCPWTTNTKSYSIEEDCRIWLYFFLKEASLLLTRRQMSFFLQQRATIADYIICVGNSSHSNEQCCWNHWAQINSIDIFIWWSLQQICCQLSLLCNHIWSNQVRSYFRDLHLWSVKLKWIFWLH